MVVVFTYITLRPFYRTLNERHRLSRLTTWLGDGLWLHILLRTRRRLTISSRISLVSVITKPLVRLSLRTAPTTVLQQVLPPKILRPLATSLLTIHVQLLGSVPCIPDSAHPEDIAPYILTSWHSATPH